MTMVPLRPTTNPCEPLMKLTPSKSCVVPEVCVAHVVTPLFVVPINMVPAPPTAHARVALCRKTALRILPLPVVSVAVVGRIDSATLLGALGAVQLLKE